MKFNFLLITIIVAFTSTAQNAVWTNVNSTNNWSDPDNWSGFFAPDNSTPVVFDGNQTSDDCTIDIAGQTCASITIQNNYLGTITIDAGNDLYVDGSISILANGFSGTLLIVNGGGLETLGSFTINASGNGSAIYTINGSLSIGGALTLSPGTFNAANSTLLQINGASCSLSSSTFTAPSGTMVLKGSLSRSTGGSFNANGGTISMNLNNNRSISANFTGSNALNNLILGAESSARILTLNSNVDVLGDLTFNSTNNVTINGATSQQLNVSGDIDVSLYSATGGTGSSSTNSTQIRLVGNTTQNIIGNTSVTSSAGILPTLVINQASGGTVSIDGRINLGRNLVINTNGAITCSSTSAIGFLNSANAATISGTTILTNIDVQDLIINKSGSSVSLSSFTPNIRITGIMTITAGTYNTNNQLTFRSTAANTSAQLAAVGGTLSGNATIERFIPGSTGRKWRFLASPVTTSDFISNNWQQQIHITGAGSGGTNCPSLTAHTNGFDATTSNSPSIYTYDEGAGAFASIASTNATNLTRGVGYRVFVRGARSQGCSLIDGTNATPNDVTLSATGTLGTGTQTLNVTNGTGGGWNLLGNPFQAIIDWDLVGRTNVGSTYYTFNPTAGLGGVGAYGNYTAGGSGTNGATRYIGPGHSFWVLASAAGSIAVEEADKAVTQTGSATTLFKTSSSNDISIKISDAAEYSDEVLVSFVNGTTKCFDTDKDAVKYQFNLGVGNIATFNSCSATKYAINAMPAYTLTSTDTIGIHIRVASNTSANYKLTFAGLSAINSTLDVYLLDSYLNTYFNLKTNPVYNFSTIANNAATQGASRFSILIGTGLSALPVKLNNFTASQQGKTSKLVWITAAELNSKAFIIERSTDAVNYEAIGVVDAQGNSAVKSAYQYNDLAPVMNENNYYRLKMVDKNGKYEYSNIQIVSFMDNAEMNVSIATSVFPIPASTFVTFTIGNEINSEIDYKLYDITGNLINEAVNLVPGANNELKVNLDPSLKSGFYIIELHDNYGNSQRIKFVKE